MSNSECFNIAFQEFAIGSFAGCVLYLLVAVTIEKTPIMSAVLGLLGINGGSKPVFAILALVAALIGSATWVYFGYELCRTV